MPPRRLVLFGVVALVMLGMLGSIGGYSWYLRSAGYRTRCAAALSARLGLPSDIGSVVPRSRTAREFRDVVVWLPQRRGRAFTCRQAVVMQTPTEADPHAYEIQLAGGSCEISTRTWLRQDYRAMVEKGLRPGFARGGPQKVTFSGMNVAFQRNQFQAKLSEAAGQVDFEDAQLGRAAITCHELDGFRCAEPVLLSARFSPRATGLRVDHIDLTVPELPVRVVGLRELAGVDITSGRFSGRLIYEEHDSGNCLVVSGKCFDLELPECTGGLLPVPWRGRCPEIELRELRIENQSLTRLRFRGTLADVALGDILATWGIEGATGTLTLDVGDADLSPTGIQRFVASGTGRDISLEALTKALGLGTMTGSLNVTISDLTIAGNRLKSLDAAFIVARAINPPNWIEGRLLQEVISRTLKVKLPPVLPERIEYTQLGFKLEVRDEILHVFGTHGEHEQTILTARLFDQDVPLLFEPQRSFDLAPGLDQLRARLAARLQEQLRRPAEHRTP